MDTTYNLAGQKIAAAFRQQSLSVATDVSARKLAKKISAASERGVMFVIVVGESETTTQQYTLKNLITGIEKSGTLDELVTIARTECAT